MKKWGTLCFALTLGACQTLNTHYGRGPIKLEPSVARGYTDYRAIDTVDKAMAVNAAGDTFAVARCGVGGNKVDPSARCAENPEWLAIKWCEERGRGQCKIYASGSKIVWDGATSSVSPISQHASAQGPTQTSLNNNRARKILVMWTGQSAPLIGLVEFNTTMTSARISLDLPGGTEKCLGISTLTEKSGGTWVVGCDGGITGTGSWTGLGANKGSIGEGIDNKGNKITFVIDESR